MPKNLSSRTMLELTAHYSKLRRAETLESQHGETALRHIVTAFHPGRAEGPAGEALHKAFETMERAYASDVDPDTGQHIPRSMTKRLCEMAGQEMADNANMPMSGTPLQMGDVAGRCDARGFPLHIWHPGEGRYVPAKWGDSGELLSPDLSEWLAEPT